MSDNRNILIKTCDAIGAYYELMGKSKEYYDSKFSKWFEEQEMEIDEMDDEFTDIDSCTYLVFAEEEFPFKHNITKYKEELQFEIMKYCFEYHRSPTLYQIDEMYKKIKYDNNDNDDNDHHDEEKKSNTNDIFDNIDINIMYDDKLIIETKSFYMNEYPYFKNLILKKSINSKELLMMFTIEYKYNNINFIQFIIDTFIRDKWLYYKKTNKDLKITSWITKFKFINNLNKNKIGIKDIMRSGIKYHLENILYPFKFNLINKIINDKIENTINYIKYGLKFTNELNIFPLQFDLCIMFKNCQTKNSKNHFQKNKNKNKNNLNDIENRLKSNDIKYCKQKQQQNQVNFMNQYKILSQKQNNGNDDINNNSLQRFCALIIDNDTIFWIPSSSNNVSQNIDINKSKTNKNPMKLTYFDSILQCLIPSSSSSSSSSSVITCNSTMSKKNGLLIFSFHIISMDDISCYLFWNGKYFRFMPKDVTNILPKLFVDSNENKQFINNYNQNNNNDKITFIDTKFNTFYDKNKLSTNDMDDIDDINNINNINDINQSLPPLMPKMLPVIRSSESGIGSTLGLSMNISNNINFGLDLNEVNGGLSDISDSNDDNNDNDDEQKNNTHKKPKIMNKRMSKQLNKNYRGNISINSMNPLMIEPEILQFQKSISRIEDDIDLKYRPKQEDSNIKLLTNCKKSIKQCQAMIDLKYFLHLYKVWGQRDKKPKQNNYNHNFSYHNHNNHNNHNNASQKKGIYTVFNENKRTINELLTAYYHLITFHEDLFDEIYDELVIIYKDKDKNKDKNKKNRIKCNIKTCGMLKRNYRNKQSMTIEQNRRKMYNNFSSSREIITQQLLDKIHCHLIHSYDLGLKIRKNSQFNNDNLVPIKKYFKSLKIENIFKNNTNNIDIIDENKYILKPREQKEQNEPYHEIKDSDTQDILIYGNTNINKDFEPKHHDLKQEMLNILSPLQWKDIYFKAKQYIDTLICKYYQYYQLEHILSCLIYCNFSWIHQLLLLWLNTDRKDFNFGHLTKLIKQTIDNTTTNMDTEKDSGFFISIDKDIIITPSTNITFKSLISLTKNKIVGLNFTNNNHGILLKIDTQIENSKHFDCKFLSDFAAENEILFFNNNYQFNISNMINMSLDYDYSMYCMLINIIDNIDDEELIETPKSVIIDDKDDNDDNETKQADDNDDNDDNDIIEINNHNDNYLMKSVKYFCKINSFHDEKELIGLLLYILYLPPEIRNHTKEDYWVQCSVPNCHSFSDCLCTLRIVHILKIYQSILTCKYWLKIPILPFVTFNKNGIHYDHQQIINDFNHILSYHTNQKEEYENNMISIFEFIENKINKKCNNKDDKNRNICESFERHCRSKPLYSAQQISEGGKDIVNESDIHSELDRIHVYFLHSLCKYTNNIIFDNNDKNNMEYKQRIKAYMDYNRERIHLRGSSIFNDETNYNTDISEYSFEDDISSTATPTPSSNQILDEPITSINSINSIPTSSQIIQPLNKFHFQSIPEIEQSLFHIQPKFLNIKQEVLNNDLEQLTISDWNEVLRKSRKQQQDWKKRNGIINNIDDNNDNTTDDNPNEILTQILTIKLYTDYDKLQHELKKSFRIIHEKLHNKHKYDIISEIEKLRYILSNFYHWRKSMLDTISKCRDYINFETLYHGVNPCMILSPINTLNSFWGPLSSTTNKHVASTFATNKGMVLEFSSKYPLSNFCYQFNASIISDYPEENERIIGFMYCRIRMIYSELFNLRHNSNLLYINNNNNNNDDNNDNTNQSLNWYFFSIQLFKKGIYSMSKQIEPFLIQILDETLELISKHNIKSFKQFTSKTKKKTGNVRFLLNTLAKSLFDPAELSKKDKDENKNKRDFQLVRIDDISNGLRKYFLKEDDGINNNNNDYYWRISLMKILKLFPTIEEIRLVNHYIFDDLTLKYIVSWLNKHNENNQLKSIKYTYFDYKYINQVKHIQDIDTSIEIQLDSINWEIKQKKLKKYGYLIELKRKNY